MSKKLATQPIVIDKDGQTPFERFKAALSQIVAVPKSSLLKPQKKSKK
jgi:hypothetical protein